MTFAQPFHEYEVLDRVGSGSMGTVFKARHKKLNRIVALKVLKPSLARDTRYVDRLRREARIVASLNHPNIVTGYDLGQEGGYHFFVMEFVEGKSLRELLHEWGIFSEDRVLDVAIEITIALDHAFKKGVIHRDIKPGNILIDENNVVKLTDMGLAKGPDNLAITRDGATVGTPQYISPEQAKSPQDVDIRSDLYSLGATLFHMCTGQPPFRAETMANVLVKVLEERAPSAVGINPDLSDGLNLIIRKLLSKNPARRYQTPADLLADLQRVQRSERPEVDLDELDSGEEDGRRSTVWAAVGAVLVIGTAVFSYWYVNRDGDEPVLVKVEPRADYRKQLEDGLRGHERIGDKLGHIARLAAIAEKDFEREVLLEQKKRWEQALTDQLPKLMRAENKRFATTFAGLRWTNTAEDMRRHLANKIGEEFGVEVSKLPVAARREYQLGWSGIERLLEQHIDTRESGYRTAVNDYVERLAAKVRDSLRIGNIADADRQLRDGLRVSAFGSPLGSPPVEQLPDGLRQHVENAIASARSVADKELLAREGDWVQKFAEAQQNGVAEVRELLVAGKPLRAADKLSRLERELRDDFPPAHFRAGADPWVEARAVLRRTGSDVSDHRVRATREEFRQALKIAYELFARRGDSDVAAKTLALYSPNADPQRLQAHADLLKQASRVRELLLEGLLPARSSNRRIRVPLARGDKPVQVEVVRRGSTVVFEHSKSEVSLALLKVPALCALVGGNFTERLSDELRTGLALWYVLSGEGKTVDSAVAGLIGEPQRELFQQDILGLEVRPKAPDALVAQDRLESIRGKIANSRWIEADAELTQLRTAHSEFAKEWAHQLSVIERRIDDGKKRQELLRRMLAKRRPGMTVEVDADLQVSVGLDIRKAKFAPADRVGWQHEASQPAHYPGRGVALSTARKQSLVIPTLLSVDEPVRATLELSFPEEGDHPRLLFVDCHGATLGLGLTRSGIVAAVQVDRGLAASGSVDAFKRAAHKALKAAELRAVARVVPGARHRFAFVVRKKSGSRQTVVVSVLLESVEIGRLEFRRQPTARPELTLTPMSPVTLHAIALHGRG